MTQATKQAAPAPQPQQPQSDGLDFLSASNVVPIGSDAAERIKLKETAKKLVHEAVIAWDGALESETEGTEKLSAAAFGLYEAVQLGAMTTDEVKAMLGDAVGYEPKKDGTPGQSLRKKTAGRPIEQRVRRAVMVQKHLAGETVYPFAKERPKDDMAAIMHAVDAGETSIWSAYDQLGKLKERGTVNKAFDVKVIAAIADALGKDDAADTLLADDPLRLAYGRLVENLRAIGSKT